MKVLVTGCEGLVGYDVMNELVARGHEVVGSDLAASYPGSADKHAVEGITYIPMDVTDVETVRKVVVEVNPDAVIHLAAWTDVDAAEIPENLEKAAEVNTLGTKNVAEACRFLDCKMLFPSTEYVFSGDGVEAWEADSKYFAPLNSCGKTKLWGERYVADALYKYFVVRVAWLFGINGQNFVNTMLEKAETEEVVKVVKDQIGTPTYTVDLARLLVDMIETERYGFYNATNEGGYVSRAEFAEEIYRLAGCDTKVKHVTTEEYGLCIAKRPFNSRLDKTKLTVEGFKPLPDWRDALARFLEQKKQA